MSNFDKIFDKGKYYIKPLDFEPDIVVEKLTPNGYETVLEVVTEDVTEIISSPGFYRVSVSEVSTPVETFTVGAFFSILESASKTVEDIFCNTKSSCYDIGYKDCTKINDALHKLITFVEYMNSAVQPYLSHVFDVSRSEEIENTLCTVDTESIEGKYVDSLKHIKKLIAKYYIAIHLFYKDNINALGFNISMEYIDSIMNFDKVICCIEKETNYRYGSFERSMSGFSIDVSYLNQAPTVGSYYSLQVDANAVSVVTLRSAFFTTDTTPAYSDPEGDPPYKLKFTSLPTEGEIILDGSPVTVGQEILFTDIDNSLLKYDVSNVQETITAEFNFSVSDTGSELFSS